MLYSLPDGKQIDLSKVSEIGSIRDLGHDPSSIDASLIAFNVRLKNGIVIKVSKQYHYNDWVQAKKELDVIYHQLKNSYDEFKETHKQK